MPAVLPNFADDLQQFGPHAATAACPLPTANAYCRRLATGHYENFPVLSIVLPRRLRQHFANVYAFCRWADDLGDEVADPTESLRLLTWWKSETDACFAGQARHPVFVALKETIREFHLSPQPFDDLISAFQQDQTQSTYDTFNDLQNYCRRSANPVGRIVLQLCGRNTPENMAMSDQVCTGLQLINFWQDVARDAELGRSYLPVEDRRRFDYDDANFAGRRCTPEFRQLMQFEVQRARELLEQGLPLARRMPGRLKLVIGLFTLGGLAICDRVAAIDYNVWAIRPKVRKSDLPRLMLKATRNALL